MDSHTVKSVSAPTTPTEQSKHLHPTSPGKKKKKLKVHFPADEILVSCYLDPPDPWSKGHQLPVNTVLSAYVAYCEKQSVLPSNFVVDQLKVFESNANKCVDGTRIFNFSLVNENLARMQCEALEEVFRRIKFLLINLEGCCLEDEQAAAALFDMIEYYDSATQLNISYIKHIDCRGWQACARMLKKTGALVHLNVQSTTLSEPILLTLGKPLRLGSNLTTLHVENCGIHGRCLVILVAALKCNTTLRELFLADNSISSSDGFQLGNLLRTNVHLELLDLSDNKLQNEGLVHLMDSLGQQSNTSGRGLSTLILWNNELTQDGMSCIARALNSARRINRFNLGNNDITSKGINDLKLSFICNQTLEELELQNCNITSEGVEALAEYISLNSIIQKVDLRCNDIGLSGIKAISKVLADNHTMVSFQIDPQSKDANESANDRTNELQLISQYCNRNQDEQSYKPPQDMYLTTLFNGIFSRVLPPSALIESEDVNQYLANNNTKRGRFKVLTVSLEEEEEILNDIVRAEKEKASLKSAVLDARAKFFSELKIPSKSVIPLSPSMPSPPVTVPVNNVPNCNGTSESVIPNVNDEDSNDVFVDCLDNWSKADLHTKRRHSDVPICHLHRSNPHAENKALGSDVVPRLKSSLLRNRNPGNLNLSLSADHSTDLPHIEFKERRLSSPNVPTEPPIFRKVHSIKCCKALESLDLCSTIPLSPTKLYENFTFPQNSVEDITLPPQNSAEKPCTTSYMVH